MFIIVHIPPLGQAVQDSFGGISYLTRRRVFPEANSYSENGDPNYRQREQPDCMGIKQECRW